jgi:streptogramin lyase
MKLLGLLPPAVLSLSLGGALVPHRGTPVAGDSLAPSAAYLALLPDGEEKRRFVLDCTGCHQFDERRAFPNGNARTEAEWRTAIQRMLSFAGPTSGFPVISAHVDSVRTAAWLAARLRDKPEPGRAAAPIASRADIVEFAFPVAQDLPHDLAIGADGRIVVTGMFTHAMHVLDPGTGAWTDVSIPVPQANPRAVEVGPGGEWWVVLGAPQKLARYRADRWDVFDVGVYAHSVAINDAGEAFVNGHFTRDPELIVGIDSAGRQRSYELARHPTMAASPGGPIPYELRTAPDGRIWMSELQGNRILSLDPRTGESAAYTLPTTFSGPRRLDVAPDGTLWIPAYAAGLLVRFDPRTARFREIRLPVADALPYIARVDSRRGRIWIGTAAADELLAYLPDEHRWERYPLPSRGALVRHMAIDERTGDLWLAYGESPGKLPARIARVRLRD